MIQTRLSARLGAILMLLAMLITLLPITVSAEEDTASAAYTEPMLLRADDYSEAVTGFHLFADNPENLPLQISYAIYKATDTATPLAIPDGWITITSMEQTADDDAAQTARPVFAVSFHKPGDINVEDPAYIESPEFLRAVSVSGSPVYTLAPGYIAAFRIVGGTAAEDGTYPLDHTLTWQSEFPVVSFSLDRPAKLITRLTQNENEHGSLNVHVLNSDTIRYLHNRFAIDETKNAFLAEYGLSDAQLYIQYDQTRMDVPSSYDAEADDGITEVWSPETLEAIPKEFDQSLGFNYSHAHSFNEEAFRAFFPEGTFTEKTVDDGDDATEDPAFWTIDTETVSLAVRARYVFALTAQDGTVYYQKSAFTDPFYCGASNSLVADPTALEAPVLSNPIFETSEDGSVTLSYDIDGSTSARDASFWCITYGRGQVGYEIELSVNGSEWVAYDADIDSTLLLYEDGNITFPVPADMLSEYAYIRVRMRLTAPEIPLQSEWSAALAFDIKPEETVTAPESEVTLPLYTESTAGEGELKYVCPICGFCPAPYGVCLFLWLGAALLIVLLIVLIIALIPKKKYCPRCSASCKPQDKSCTTCGYRFVGNMPEIEETTGDITLPKEKTPEDLEHEEVFFDNALRDGAEKPPRVTPVNIPDDDPLFAPESKTEVPQPQKPEPNVNTANTPIAPAAESKPDAAFAAELKRKMAAVKAGQKVSFTPEEIAYIKVLKEKAAAKNAPAAPVAPAVPPAEPKPAAVDRTPVVRAEPAQPQTPSQEESREAQIARLRALRAKQLSAEDTAKLETPQTKEAPAEQIRRVEKPAKQIKCPACAVPNPETNGQCYICGTRLK